jgi:hypothetical protein
MLVAGCEIEESFAFEGTEELIVLVWPAMTSIYSFVVLGED